MFLTGSWGTVSDYGWDMRDVQVVCRQLGLGAAVKALGGAFFGWGRGPIKRSKVDCIGHETALGWCRHLDWNRLPRSHSRDASVVCQGIYTIIYIYIYMYIYIMQLSQCHMYTRYIYSVEIIHDIVAH